MLKIGQKLSKSCTLSTILVVERVRSSQLTDGQQKQLDSFVASLFFSQDREAGSFVRHASRTLKGRRTLADLQLRIRHLRIFVSGSNNSGLYTCGRFFADERLADWTFADWTLADFSSIETIPIPFRYILGFW